jgi:type II secretory pathway pseudopilin PulG
MHVRRGGTSGFSLVEAVVAGALLLLTCVSVSTLLTAALRAEGATQRRSALEVALAAERERLAALPYYRPVTTPEEVAAGTAPSLVGEVFPHALAAYNTASGSYRASGDGGEPGSFESTGVSEGVRVTRTARFLQRWPGSPRTLGPADLDGWAAWHGDPPPGGALAIRLTAEAGGRQAVCVITVSADRVRAEPSAAPAVEAGHGS